MKLFGIIAFLIIIGFSATNLVLAIRAYKSKRYFVTIVGGVATVICLGLAISVLLFNVCKE